MMITLDSSEYSLRIIIPAYEDCRSRDREVLSPQTEDLT